MVVSRYELLNNVSHRDLRVITSFGVEFGHGVGLVPAYPTEFARLQQEYPIFFRRRPSDGEYEPVALLGFSADENLFLKDDRWDAGYVPAHIAKGPFAIGFQQTVDDGEAHQKPVIHVDMDDPRVSFDDGQPIFLPRGGRTPYLEHVVTVLNSVGRASIGGTRMYSALEAAHLIQPVDLNVTFDGEHAVDVAGLYGIDRDRLEALTDSVLCKLHRAGYLEGAYLMLASLQNLSKLVNRKRRRLDANGSAPIEAN